MSGAAAFTLWTFAMGACAGAALAVAVMAFN